MAASASLQLQGHTRETEGPWNLRIAPKFQPPIIQGWTAKQVFLSMEQPNKDDNFTLIRVLYLRGVKKPSLVAGLTFRRARWRRRPQGGVEVRIKKRYGNSFPHPLPLGRYTGTCMYDMEEGFGVFTFQAITLRREPKPQEPKVIITPGDRGFNESLRNAKRTLSRTHGLGGRGANAGGLRNG
jgi:hypothetical protein